MGQIKREVFISCALHIMF